MTPRANDCGSLELAQARIGARWGEQPGEATWRRIEATRGGPGVFEIARTDPALSRWIAGLGPDTSLHALESTLRRRWRDKVTELARWMPPAWQRAVEWCALLPDLPALDHLARGDAAPAWMHDDDALRPCVQTATAPDTRCALVAQARTGTEGVLACWRTHWIALLPPEPGRGRIERELLPLLEGHAAAFASPRTVDGRAARTALRTRLVLLMRRAVGEPALAFGYLATQALDLERLRGELVQRAAFPARAVAS